MLVEKNRVAVDVGGTFTDCVLLLETGRRYTAKALTTPRDPSRGVISAVEAVAEKAGYTLDQLLAETVAFVHGTTVGTNILTERRGARTGLLMTRGHHHTITIGRVRQKVTGLSEREKIHITHLSKANPPIVAPEDICPITERVDSGGQVVVPLDMADSLKSIERLVGSGINSFAVCLLWSFAKPDHEQTLKQLILGANPRAFVSLSSEVAAVAGEYERCVSTVFNSYIGSRVGDYLGRLESELHARGMKCSVMVMQSNGGLSTVDFVSGRPIVTVDSGPAGGVLGAAHFAHLLDERSIVCADVGGTTFDVGLIFNERIQMDPSPVIDRYAYVVPKIYVKSVGAGGGSIAWIDQGGKLRVGPKSAGSNPGPAAYGQGGTEPTVTDAHLVLGYLDPIFPLGEKVLLNKSLAEEALLPLATKLSVSIVDIAAAVVEISNAQMSDLIRKVTAERGLDPRNFAIFSYGGAGPIFAAFLAQQIGASKVYVPGDSGVFSAFGMLTTDVVFQEQQSVLLKTPFDVPQIEKINRLLDELHDRVANRFESQGYDRSRVSFRRSVDMRFSMQVHELDVDLPARPIDLATLEESLADFVAKYERTYGKGSSYKAAGVEIVTARLFGTVEMDRPRLDSPSGPGARTSILGTRNVYFPSLKQFVSTEIHAGAAVVAGQRVNGPAIIQRIGDTIVIPPKTKADVDRHGTIAISSGVAA